MTDKLWIVYFFFPYFLLVLNVAEGRDKDKISIHLDVPQWAKVGGEVRLGCKYDVGGDPVYQVKWYKGKHEFYRYTPKESPPVKTFLFAGLDVDLYRSNASVLTLQRLDFSTRGVFGCEVTTDTPDFLTAYQSAHLDVIAIPESGPVISRLKPSYSIGDMIEANCTSYRSRPPVNLTWYINSREVKRDNLVPHYGWRVRQNANETSHLNLRFTLRPEDFHHGRVTLRCTARIHNYYEKHSEATILEADNPKLSSVVDNSSSSSSSIGNVIVPGSGSPCHVAPSPYFTSIFSLLTLFLLHSQLPSFQLSIHLIR